MIKLAVSDLNRIICVLESAKKHCNESIHYAKIDVKNKTIVCTDACVILRCSIDFTSEIIEYDDCVVSLDALKFIREIIKKTNEKYIEFSVKKEIKSVMGYSLELSCMGFVVPCYVPSRITFPDYEKVIPTKKHEYKFHIRCDVLQTLIKMSEKKSVITFEICADNFDRNEASRAKLVGLEHDVAFMPAKEGNSK